MDLPSQKDLNSLKPRTGHCMAYDKEDDVLFVTGGYYYTAKSTVWKFNDPEKFLLNGTTQMKKTRYYHACGIVRSDKHNGRPLLVVAGSNGGPGTKTCEFYDYTKANSQWQPCSESKSLFYVLCQLCPNGNIIFDIKIIS